MKIEVKKVDSTKREITVEVTGDVVKNKFEDVFKEIAKEAKVPGFRPGHAPRDMLEKHYSSLVHEQVLKELIPDVYNQAIEKESLDAVELPVISDVKLDRSTLSFKAEVDVHPQMKLQNYKGLKAEYKKVIVSTEEIKRNIDSLKESHKVDTVDDNFAHSLCYPNLQELEKAIERQVFTQKENAQRQKIEADIIDTLTKDIDFKLPQSLVNRQLRDLVRQAKLDMALRGASKEKIDEQEKSLTEYFDPEAKRQVKVYLVLAHIAKKENIALDEHMTRKVMEFLLKEADWKLTDALRATTYVVSM